MRKFFVFMATAAGLAVIPAAAHAQTITPQIGVYIPGNSVDSLRTAAKTVRVQREGTLALGLNIDLGVLRGSIAYATAAKLNDKTSTNTDVGKGKLIAAAADLVIRPIPRLIVIQPYLLAGAGVRRADYSYDTSGFDAFPKNDTDLALHAGVGADIMLGPVGVSAEVTDFISKDTADKWKQHDAFGFAGLRLKF